MLPSASLARPFVTCYNGRRDRDTRRCESNDAKGLHLLAIGIFGLLAATVLLDDVQDLNLSHTQNKKGKHLEILRINRPLFQGSQIDASPGWSAALRRFAARSPRPGPAKSSKTFPICPFGKEKVFGFPFIRVGNFHMGKCRLQASTSNLLADCHACCSFDFLSLGQTSATGVQARHESTA